MSKFANIEHLDNVLSFILIKKLLTRTVSTKAYKLGLVDEQGKTIKTPETEEEKAALSNLQKFIFKLKRMLGSRINELSNFLYVNAFNDDLEDFLTVKGGVQNKASVKRVQNDLLKLAEKYDMEIEELVECLMYTESKEFRNYIKEIKNEI
jgi:hypothetical protein